jgi:hypothetical protein
MVIIRVPSTYVLGYCIPPLRGWCVAMHDGGCVYRKSKRKNKIRGKVLRLATLAQDDGSMH